MSKKSISISKSIWTGLTIVTMFFVGQFMVTPSTVLAQRDNFNFDAGNIDPADAEYDWNGWSPSEYGAVSTPQNSGPGLGACGAKIERLQDILTLLNCYISTGLVPIIFTLALIYFILGVIKYVVSDSEKDKAKGRQFMIWGIVALFAMVSVWGLVKVIGNTFGVTADVKVLPLLPE